MFRYFKEKKVIREIIEKSKGNKGYIFDKVDLINIKGIKDLDIKFFKEGVEIKRHNENLLYNGTHLMLKSMEIKTYIIV